MSVGTGITVEEAIRRGLRKGSSKYKANLAPPKSSTQIPLKRGVGTLRKGGKQWANKQHRK